MDGKSCFMVIMTVIALYHTVLGNHPLQKRNLALTPEQITCIRTEFMQSNPTQACTTAQAALELLYNVNDVVAAIGTRLDLFVFHHVDRLSSMLGEHVICTTTSEV